MKIVFMGTPQAAVPSLERLIADDHEVVCVYTQPDRPAGRGNKLTMPPVKEAALAHGIEVRQPLKIKTPEALDEFRSIGADVAVIVAYGRILTIDHLTAFPHGAINVHFSLLPKYRGAAPVNWAIVNGENTTGVTTMRMDEGLDTGDILMQSETAIGVDETAPELMERLSHQGAELLSQTLASLDTVVPRPQDDSVATLAPIMRREDGLIDWSQGSREIASRVRGFQPFPGSFTLFAGKKVTFWRANAIDESTAEHAGTVISSNGKDLRIACGGGSVLRIEELQIEGKRRMTTADFLNGVRLPVGAKLGEPGMATGK
ncbi:MAG: methionyl-tRNA formyltransferase [Pyrinomonadaceae bacterium]|nr:methionyl-tRNA formyltransferase [Pyrinomonadaceae bacterium]